MRAKYYSEDMPSVHQERKCVIYMEDGRAPWKIGLSDRIRGIVFAYMICRDLGVDFYINFNDPFELSNYLEPNELDWGISSERISYNSRQSDVLLVGTYNESCFEGKIKYNYTKKLIENSDKKQIHIYTNMVYKANGRYSQCFEELFKPANIVQKNIDLCKSEIDGKYVSVTLRFQCLLGDFSEGERKTIVVEEEVQNLIARCEAQIEKIHQRHPDKTILVTSDSKTFLSHIDKLPYTYIIKGELVHMAYTDDNSLNTHKKAFVDYLMIAGAEKIYLLRTGDMYNSGFPRSAALINNRPYEAIQF